MVTRGVHCSVRAGRELETVQSLDCIEEETEAPSGEETHPESHRRSGQSEE